MRGHLESLLSAVGCLALCVTIAAQDRTGGIAGRVTEQGGKAATGLTVEAKNVTSGVVYKAALTANGSYALTKLPPGAYDVSIPTAFGAFREAVYQPYSQTNVTVQAGQTLQLNIEMKIYANLATLGDAPPAMLAGMRERATVSTKPTPRMGDGKPDFSGVWLNASKEDPPLPLQPWAQEVRKTRLADTSQLTRPKTLCLPSGPIQMFQDFPYQIIQGRSGMVILQDVDVPGWRQIFLDGRKHPADWNPSWLGHSIGVWEGDTLVVDTVGFNDKGWLQNGSPNTEQLHVIERIRRPDEGHLEIDFTVEDPGALTGVWKGKLRAILAAKDEQVVEYVCESNTSIVPHLQH